MIVMFDLSISCSGYSIFSEDGKFIKTGHVKTNEKQSTPLRLKYLAKNFRNLKKEYKPKKIVIEKGFYKHAGSTEQIFRVHGITNLIFCDSEQHEIHATSVRKLVTGHGNINKEQLNQYIQENYPKVKFLNYDEMDSFALGIAYFKQQGVL